MITRISAAKAAKDAIVTNSLWLVGLGLMLASSGIDGAYMAAWMGRHGWLGYILNTTSDITGLVLMYWFGRLRQDRSSVKRRLAWGLFAMDLIAAAYSWFFSWRQLRIVLPAVEGPDAPAIAAIAAGFVPLLLAFAGYAQALVAGRLGPAAERRPVATPGAESIATVATAVAKSETGQRCPHCKRELSAGRFALSGHLAHCQVYQEVKSNGRKRAETPDPAGVPVSVSEVL